MAKAAVDAPEPKMAVIANVSRDNLISFLFSFVYQKLLARILSRNVRLITVLSPFYDNE
jgi:hypothetical protein